MSGLLIRSALVSGWPNLAVRPTGAAGEPLKTLRMDRLAPSVLLCLFAGIPAHVELSEPQEGLRFGVEPDGTTELRNPVAGAGLGSKLARSFPVRDPAGKERYEMRAEDHRVLDAGRLVHDLGVALGAGTDQDFSAPGPADFALQMIRSPESIAFNAPGAP
jgi:hypothetical protein